MFIHFSKNKDEVKIKSFCIGGFKPAPLAVLLEMATHVDIDNTNAIGLVSSFNPDIFCKNPHAVTFLLKYGTEVDNFRGIKKYFLDGLYFQVLLQENQRVKFTHHRKTTEFRRWT